MFLRALVSAADKFVTEIEADREFRREVGRLKIAAIRDLSQVGSQAVAMLLAKYFPGAVTPQPTRTQTVESMTIDGLLQDLTARERREILGDWTDAGECLKRGILDPSQVKIFLRVMKGESPVTDLDLLVDEGSPDQLTVQQYADLADTLGRSVDKLMPLVKILQDRKAVLQTKVEVTRAAAEAARAAAYVPEPPRRTVLEDGHVSYESSTDIVSVGTTINVVFGVEISVEGTGFPGFPETMVKRFGVVADFKPEAIRIPPGFALVGAFAGDYNMMMNCQYGVSVPAEAFEPGRTQPDYPVARKGMVITLQVKNVFDKPLPFRGQIVGREIESDEAPKFAKEVA